MTNSMRTWRWVLAATASLGLVTIPNSAGAAWTAAMPAVAAPAVASPAVASPAVAGPLTSLVCPPSSIAVAFSDALDRTAHGTVPVSELSALALDRRFGDFISVSDDNPVLFFVRDPFHPRVKDTVKLRRSDGSAYDGDTLDGEGVAVLREHVLVSSETEPSIRIFGRDGLEQGSLPIPARLRVAPVGEGRLNGTLESLTVSPSGQYVYSSMEAPLTGDSPGTGEALIRRMLVYSTAGGFRLIKQIGYQADPGHRIAEIVAYADGRLLVLEIQFTPGVGNDLKLYAVTNANAAADVSNIVNLSAAPANVLVSKQLVANVTGCPSLGAATPGTQVNPLLDNYEGLAAVAPLGRGPALVHLLSDNNASAAQVTRLLTLVATLP